MVWQNVLSIQIRCLMMKYEYKSILAPVIESLIDMKHNLGFKYVSESKLLRRVDRLALNHRLDDIILMEDFVNEFIKKYDNEKDINITSRVTVIRELARFMIAQGYKAYVVPPLPRGSYRSSFVPYIFTNEELKKIFLAADQFASSLSLDKHYYHQRDKYPVIFRILYSTGMRIGEVLQLQLQDIDFERKTFIIKEAKNNKDRIIPVHPVTIKYMKNYIGENNIFDDNQYVFTNRDNQPITTRTVYGIFRKVLRIAGIPHAGKSKGPTVHSFRHTFCVHRLRDWVIDGRDISALFPYLCAYMGHADTRCTEYYLRLTAELYPDIVIKSEKYFNEGSDINE